VYWTDQSLGRVCVTRADPPAVGNATATNVTVVLLQQRHYSPRSIVIDPANG
jgi:pantothenate kinase